MTKRQRLRWLARKAAGHACVAGWLISHNMRGAWQARAVGFEMLMVRYYLPGYEEASEFVRGWDSTFNDIFSPLRDKYGHETVRESQTRTGCGPPA